MRKLKWAFILLLLETTAFNISKAQEWAWLRNHSIMSSPGIYTSIGDVHSNNTPGGRTTGAMWFYNNSVYIFGGFGWDKNSDEGFLNDLWRYDLATDKWIWLSGSSVRNSPGNYGTINIPAVTNTPSARSDLISWEHNGEFYLFGGNGYDIDNKQGLLNDIWKFNPTNNTWTWISGNGEFNEPANHGVINTPAVSNTPGGRAGAIAWNINNKMYLYGGVIAQSKVEGSSVDRYGDLWEYDLVINTWTWIKGNSLPNTPSFHLAQGVASPLNEPGTRRGSIPGEINGQLYLLGGFNIFMGAGGTNNDLWKFDPSTNMWTWVKGDDGADINGVYGQIGVENVQNKPGSRSQTKMWVSNNALYLFGGIGQGESQGGHLSDIWKYNPASNAWTWVGGSKEIEIESRYGAQGHFSINNTPSGRASIYISNNQTDIYLFGGIEISDDPQFGGVSLNDLWQLKLIQQQGSSVIENFRAKKIRDAEVELTWDVPNPAGITSFVIEHGVDSLNFVSIGSVPANSSTSYSFIHSNPLFQKNYYRIKVINQDNSISYSEVLVINMGNSSFVKIIQNPVNSVLAFTCENIAGNSIVQIVNTNGNILQEKAMMINADIKTIDVSNLSPGLYSLVVILKGFPSSALFIKN